MSGGGCEADAMVGSLGHACHPSQRPLVFVRPSVGRAVVARSLYRVCNRVVINVRIGFLGKKVGDVSYVGLPTGKKAI